VKKLKPSRRRTLAVALLAGGVVAMLAEISVNPFGTAFRFSLGPVVLALCALVFRPPAYLIGAAAGVAVPVVHSLFVLAQRPTLAAGDAWAAVRADAPESVAYALLGLLLSLLRVHERTATPLRLAALLAAADFLANAVELAVRAEPFRLGAAAIMAGVGLARAVVSAGAVHILREGVRARWEEERRSYIAQLLFLANLQTEAFFLQKSGREMEQIMSRAHRLYRSLDGHPEQPLALEIAKDIHEVKKDYQRTLSALYRLVDVPTLEPEMRFAEVVALVFDANRTYAATLGKAIALESRVAADFRTARYGRWISILNNLVSNAIEACRAEGAVTLSAERAGDRFLLRIADTGTGIPEEDWGVVFSPGFSTKFNPVTGAYSSGLGLTHVAGLVAAMQGEISVERSGPHGTVFRIAVPWDSLEAVERE
jgi:two-component system sensor histidine kinase YcbA